MSNSNVCAQGSVIPKEWAFTLTFSSFRLFKAQERGLDNPSCKITLVKILHICRVASPTSGFTFCFKSPLHSSAILKEQRRLCWALSEKASPPIWKKLNVLTLAKHKAGSSRLLKVVQKHYR